jgi:hypothetical protein
MSSVALIDYGSGNLASAAKALARAANGKSDIITTADPQVVLDAERVVLPGVGAFADCMRGLSAVPGMIEALRDAPAQVVAVSPLVGGEVVKGPTEAFLTWAGAEMSAEGIARYYGDVLDGIVSDERDAELPVASLVTDTLMAGAAGSPARRSSSRWRSPASVRSRCGPSPCCPSSASRAPSSACARRSTASPASASPRRWWATCSRS